MTEACYRIKRDEMTAMELLEKELGHALNISIMMTKGVVEATDKTSHDILAIEMVHRLYPEYAEVLDCVENVILIDSPEDEADEANLMTVTEIGANLQLTARRTNKLLLEKGLQRLENQAGKRATYVPTAKGSEWAIVKGNSIKWYPSVLEQIRG